MTVTVMPFGKYAGHSYESVVQRDAQYLIWCHNNLVGFYLSIDQLIEARSLAAQQYKPRLTRSRRSWQNWDDEIDCDDTDGPYSPYWFDWGEAPF